MNKPPQCLVSLDKSAGADEVKLVEEVAFGLFSDGTVRMRSTIEDPEEALDMVAMTVDFMRNNMVQAEEASANGAMH